MESRELFWGINTQHLIMFYMLGTLSMLVFLGLVTYWPGLSLWFPRMLGMI